MRAGFVISRLLQMAFPCRPGRKLASFLCLDFRKAAVFVGVGRWLHDTPPIFPTG
jgi:hypothetical protein